MLYHINGICEIEYPHKKVEEFYVDDVVDADSEVQAITAVATQLQREQSVRNFIWTRLHVAPLPS